jgi:hypothetical protein
VGQLDSMCRQPHHLGHGEEAEDRDGAQGVHDGQGHVRGVAAHVEICEQRTLRNQDITFQVQGLKAPETRRFHAAGRLPAFNLCSPTVGVAGALPVLGKAYWTYTARGMKVER